MLKNATPRQITLYCTLAIVGTIALSLFMLKTGGYLAMPWSFILTLCVVLFVSTYSILIYTIRRYIYRKIKLIYKNIHSHKVAPSAKLNTINIDSDILEEVEKDVAEWADNQQKEIENLKLLESYRRNFLGDISHELKTPLFNIQGYVHTLLDGGLYDDKINKSYLQRAATNVERLHTIIEDLEAISKLESGGLVLELQQFDIKTLTSEVFNDLEIFAKEANIQLFFKEGADTSFTVRADRENIRQVLTNLIINSIKYGIHGGHTKVGFYNMESYILVEVADNGIGISEKDLNHVFDRFYRVDKSRSRAQGGSGLGLSIVKHIMEAHKQTINVRSTLGLGSTFGFTLEKV